MSTPVRLLNTNELLAVTDGAVTLPATPRKLLAVQVGKGGPAEEGTAGNSEIPSNSQTP